MLSLASFYYIINLMHKKLQLHWTMHSTSSFCSYRKVLLYIPQPYLKLHLLMHINANSFFQFTYKIRSKPWLIYFITAYKTSELKKCKQHCCDWCCQPFLWYIHIQKHCVFTSKAMKKDIYESIAWHASQGEVTSSIESSVKETPS